MHEASIAMSIIEIAEKHCRDAGYEKIKAIELRIGKGSGVMPEALRMAFDIVKIDTLAAGSEMTIDIIPIGGLCSACEKEFVTDDQFLIECPHCQSDSFKLSKGREMDIISIEVD